MSNDDLFAAANVEKPTTPQQAQWAEDCAIELLTRAISSRPDAGDADKLLRKLPAHLQKRYGLTDFLGETTDPPPSPS